MEEIDISILKKAPELTEKVTIEIEPLAPLSMVSDLPGSFYKSLKSPSKKMLCGLFENLLGWHFSINDRTSIQKELIKARKKQNIQYSKPQQGSTYIPLLMEYFDIKLITIPEYYMYNDLWSKAYRRADTVKHLGGTRYMDGHFLIKWNFYKALLKKDLKRNSKEKEKLLEFLFKRYIGRFATFYSSPTGREYIQLEQPIKIQLITDRHFINLIKDAIAKNNQLYLGNSEGWINLNICNNE